MYTFSIMMSVSVDEHMDVNDMSCLVFVASYSESCEIREETAASDACMETPSFTVCIDSSFVDRKKQKIG